MILNNYENGRIFMGRLDFKTDLLDEINKIVIENNIKAGYINIIGAITGLKTGFYDQNVKEYVHTVYEPELPLEISSCMGNVSIKEGKPFCHIHIVASDRKGKCFGGHLMNGTKVFAAEFIIQEVLGEELVRGIDADTKLPLWVDSV